MEARLKGLGNAKAGAEKDLKNKKQALKKLQGPQARKARGGARLGTSGAARVEAQKPTAKLAQKGKGGREIPPETIKTARQAVDAARVALSRIDSAYQGQSKKIRALSAKIEAMGSCTRVHALLACSVEDDNKQERVILVDRDKNASKNIWHLGRRFLEGHARPTAFSPQHQNGSYVAVRTR